MKHHFDRGYELGLQDDMPLADFDQEEYLHCLQTAVANGSITMAGYNAARLASYGSDAVLDDGTTLSYQN